MGWGVLWVMFLLPLVRSLWSQSRRTWAGPTLVVPIALAAALAMNELDAILNGAFWLGNAAIFGALLALGPQEGPHQTYRIPGLGGSS